MIGIDRESVERLAATCEKRGYVSPPRNPSDYSAVFTCRESLDMAKGIRSLLDRAEAAEAREAKFREALNNAVTHHFAVLCMMRSHLDHDDFADVFREAEAACDRWRAALTDKGDTDNDG